MVARFQKVTANQLLLPGSEPRGPAERLVKEFLGLADKIDQLAQAI